MTVSRKSKGIMDIFGKKKSTYGLILQEEFDTLRAQNPRRSQRSNNRDCFAPSDMDKWELPQYESLFNHLITEDGTFRRRLSSSASNTNSAHSHSTREEEGGGQGQGSEEGSGPLRAVQKFFKDIVKSLTHHAGEYDLGGDAPVEGIPVDVCERLKYVHIYL